MTRYSIFIILILILATRFGFSQPIKPGKLKLKIINKEKQIIQFNQSVITEGNCLSYNFCGYILNSKDKKYRLRVETCSFSKLVKVISFDKEYIIINTGIRQNANYCIRKITLTNNASKEAETIFFENNTNLEEYSLTLKYEKGNYNAKNKKRRKSDEKILLKLKKYCVKKIHLSKVKSEIKGVKYEYKIKDSTNLNFIDIKHKKNMGHLTGVQFSLKEKLPDGKYKIYVDKTLRQDGHIKQNVKDGIWITYNEKGEKQLTPYKKGKVYGIIKEFYKNNSLKRETHVQANEVLFRTTYYKKGTIKTQEQFKNGHCIEIKKYTIKGEKYESTITN